MNSLSNYLKSLLRDRSKRKQEAWIKHTKASFGSCGSNVRIRHSSNFIHPECIHLGSHIHLGEGAWWRADGGITIGDHSIISRNSVIFTANHNYQGETLPYDKSLIKKPVIIENNVWVGMNVMIAQGVTIGHGAIIAMGTVVTKNVPPLAIVGSHGSRILKYRDKKKYEDLLSKEAFLEINDK